MSNIRRILKRNIAVDRGLPRNALCNSGIKLRMKQIRAMEKLNKMAQDELSRVAIEEREDGTED